MKRILSLSLICLTLMLVSGCGASSGLTFNQNQLQTNVVLSQSNFIVVKNVSGYKAADTKASAMNQMVQNAELTGSQAIVNATVSLHEQTVLGIYTKITAYATGTVIEFY